MVSESFSNDTRLDDIETASSHPLVQLYPPLGAPDDIDAFNKAGRRVSFALSPRGNSFTVYETVVSILS